MILFDFEAVQIIKCMISVHPVNMVVEDTARTEEHITARTSVLFTLEMNFPHVALHGTFLLVGFVAQKAEVAAILQHLNRVGHQGADIIEHSTIYKKIEQQGNLSQQMCCPSASNLC